MGKFIMVCTHKCTHTNLLLVWVVKNPIPDPIPDETRLAVFINDLRHYNA